MRSDFPLSDDPCYGDLGLLLSPEGPKTLLEASGLDVESTEQNYIRLKPASGALLGLTLTLRDRRGDRVELPAYIRCHDRERCAQIISKWHAGRSITTVVGDGVRLLAGGRAVLFLFPNDARVRGMRFIADTDKLKRILGELPALQHWRVRAGKTRLHVQRYKPERRLILRADLGLKDDRSGARSQRSMFLRFFVDDRGQKLAKLIAELRNQEVGPHIPEPLGCLQDGRMYVEQAVDGVEGLAHIESGRADPKALAHALIKLHRAQRIGVDGIDNHRILADAIEAGHSLSLLAPQLKSGIAAVLEAMHRQLPLEGPQAFLHGDCHLHQVLWSARGPVLVDFERCGIGNPLYDLGQALAHLKIQANDNSVSASRCAEFATKLEAEYRSMGANIDFAALPFFVTQGLMQRALLPARRLTEGWLEQCATIVGLAWEQISAAHDRKITKGFFDLTEAEGAIEWDRFYPSSGSRWPGRVLAAGGEMIYGHYHQKLRRFRATNLQQDKALPGLANALSKGELVAYRPGRRATVRCRDHGAARYIKLLRPGRIAKVLRHHLAASDAAADAQAPFPAFPSLIEVTPARGSLEFSEVPGLSLHSMLSNSSVPIDAPIDKVAESLAALHRMPVQSHRFPISAAGRSLQDWIALVRGHDPVLAEECQTTLQVICDMPQAFMRESLVHGDLHDRNILINDDGVALLDLDDFGLGDAVEEVGNLMAHFILRALQGGRSVDTAKVCITNFLASYRRHGGVASSKLVDAAIARTLLRLACLYRFRRNQASICRLLLVEVERLNQIGCRA